MQSNYNNVSANSLAVNATETIYRQRDRVNALSFVASGIIRVGKARRKKLLLGDKSAAAVGGKRKCGSLQQMPQEA